MTILEPNTLSHYTRVSIFLTANNTLPSFPGYRHSGLEHTIRLHARECTGLTAAVVTQMTAQQALGVQKKCEQSVDSLTLAQNMRCTHANHLRLCFPSSHDAIFTPPPPCLCAQLRNTYPYVSATSTALRFSPRRHLPPSSSAHSSLLLLDSQHGGRARRNQRG